ncbi:hypothetical protein D3C86_2179500 [compost metagenome]
MRANVLGRTFELVVRGLQLLLRYKAERVQHPGEVRQRRAVLALGLDMTIDQQLIQSVQASV